MLLMMLPFQVLAAGTTWQTATPLAPSGNADGRLSESIPEQWYRISVPEDGALTLTVTPSTGLTMGHVILNVVTGDGSISQRKNVGVGTESVSLTSADCAAGTYYVQLTFTEGEGNYSLRSAFTPASATGASDREPNGTWQQALPLKRGATVSGHLGYGYYDDADMTDWWQLTVPRDGRVRLWVTPQNGLEIRYITLNPLNADGQAAERTYKAIGKNQTEWVINDVAPGTYYVSLLVGNGAGTYRLQYLFEQNDYPSDQEPNNETAQAQDLEQGATVSGHLGYWYFNDRDTKDYYRIKLTENGTIEINFEPLDNLNIRFVTLHDSQGNEIAYVSGGKKAGTLKAKNQKAGTYYVSLSHSNGQGAYLLSVNGAIGTVEKLEPLPDEADDDPTRQPLPDDDTGTKYTWNKETQTVTVEKLSQTAPYIIACGPFHLDTPVKQVLIAGDIFNALPAGNVFVGAKVPPTITGTKFDPAQLKDKTLHVPAGFRKVYEKDAEWGKFSTIVDDYDQQQGTPSGPRLIVWLNNGDKVTYELADAPVTTFQGGQLVIRTNKTTAVYDRRQVLRYTFEDVVDKGIELMAGERRVQINRDGDEVVLRGLPEGAVASIYAVGGQLIEQRRASGSLPLTISLKNRPTGVYIIKAATETIKLMKQ